MKNLVGKRVLATLAICILMLIAVSGCGTNNESSAILREGAKNDAKSIPLSFFGFKADAINLTAIESALQGFMDENPNIEITYESIKGNEYYDALDRRDKSGELDDVFMSKHDNILEMASEGKLADLSDLAGVDGFSDQAKGQFVNADGKVYFLPTCISTYNLYINYDLLKEHGQSIPANWKEFQEVCDYFVSQGIVPIVANNFASLPTLITGKGLYETYQGSDVDAAIDAFNQDPALLAETLAPGVQQVADMLDRGWFDRSEVLETNQTSDDLAIFEQGDRPFMITGGWASVRVADKDPGFTYGVYPYPILDDGSVLSMQVDTCIVVNEASDHKEEAKQFVEYLIQPEVMWAYCDSQASFTPLRDETRTPSEETLAPSAEYLTNGRYVMRSDYRIALPMDKALQDCVNILLNNGTVAQAQSTLAESLAE